MMKYFGSVTISALAASMTLQAVPASAGEVKITVTTGPSVSAERGKAGNSVVNVYRLEDLQDQRAPRVYATLRGDNSDIVEGDLPADTYVFVSRTLNVQGDLSRNFSLASLIGIRVFEVPNATAEFSLPTIYFALNDCKIEPTEIFSQEYRDKEETAESRGFGFEGVSAGRLIMLRPGEQGSCGMVSKFPEEAEGPLTVHTYTPHAFQTISRGTLRFASYIYNGRTENRHDVFMHDASITEDGQSQIVIESIQEKSGVNIPWEPRTVTGNEDCKVRVFGRINFRSNESTPPATVSLSYLFFDDPFQPMNSDSLFASGCL